MMSLKKKWPKSIFNYSSYPNNIFISFYSCVWNKLFLHSFIKENDLYFQDNKRIKDLLFTLTSLVVQKGFISYKYLVYYRV